MSLLLTKVLTQLALPLGLGSLLLVSGLLLILFRVPGLGSALSLSGVLWLWLWATPLFSDWVRGSLERRYPPLPLRDIPEADGILVLGGSVDGAVSPRYFPDLSSAADRVWHAARLFHAGKAPWVILSGGRLPWRTQEAPEADAMETFLLDLGVPRDRILLETGSATTRENALKTRALLRTRGFDTLLLVTSALHMRRAVATFRNLGISVIPVATDHEILDRPRNLLDYLPDAGALAGASRAYKEYLGFWVYRMRGWIGREVASGRSDGRAAGSPIP